MISGDKYNKKKVTSGRKLAQECEWDCEKRSVALIKRLNLPLDTDVYIRKANAYILSFHLLEKYGKWYTSKNKPSINPMILAMMPNKIVKDPNNIDPELLDFMAKECKMRKRMKK